MKNHLQKSQSSIQLRQRRTSLHPFFLLLSLIFFLLSSSALAEIRYVSKTGSSTPPYTSWETASDSIQKCIDISQFGDTIYVANGVYREQVVMIRGLALIGSSIDSCIIDTRDLEIIYSVNIKDSCLFKNFRVVKSYYDIQTQEWKGVGIYFYDIDQPSYYSTVELSYIQNAKKCIRSSTTNSFIKRNFLTDCINGIELTSVSPSPIYQYIIENTIRSRYDCIRIEFGGTPYIANNICIGNGFSGSFSGLNEIYNNLFVNNGGRAIAFSDNTIFMNNVITGYSAEGILVGGDNQVVINNIIENAVVGITSNVANNPVVQYNNFWNVETINQNTAYPDSTNLFRDPMFVNDDSTKGELDFHLQLFSPLIDAGDPSILDKDSSRSDIGLYGGPLGETYTYLDLAPRAPRGLTLEADTGKATVTILWQPNTEADFSFYKVFRDTVAEFTADSTTLISTQTDTFYTHIIPPKSGQFYYKLTAVDSQGNESDVSEEIGISFTSVDHIITVIDDYQLYQNYPNPFNPETKISYKLKEPGYVKIAVYDIKGELISYIVNENQSAGYHETVFNAEGLSSGIYLYRMDVRSENNIPVYSEMKKMLLVK